MKRGQRHSREVRERSVRLVFEQQKQHPSQWAAICSIAQKSGMTPETLRKWVRQAEADEGRRGGITSDERERMREMERELTYQTEWRQYVVREPQPLSQPGSVYPTRDSLHDRGSLR